MAVAEIAKLLDLIVAVIATQTGRPVGDGAAPSEIVIPDDLPYANIQSIGEADREASFAELMTEGDLVSEIQATSVGESRKQAQWMTDRIRESFIAANLSGWTGRVIQLVELDAGNEVERDDDVQPPLFYAVDSFLVYSTPA